MGRELIIPGTPFDGIAPVDRPIFDPRVQAGFLGSSPASAPPGSVVEHYFLNPAQGVISPILPVEYFAVFNGSLGAGTGNTLLNLLGAIYSGTPINRHNLVAQALGGVTTGAVFLTNPAAQGGVNNIQGFNLTKAGNPGLTLRRISIQDIAFFNSDAAAQTVQGAIQPEWDDAPWSFYPFQVSLPAGIQLNPIDVLRIRLATLTVVQLGGLTMFFRFAPRATVSLYSGTPASANNPPLVTAELLGPSAAITTFQPITAGINNPGAIYNLARTIDVLGSDFGQTGPYAPVFEFGFWARYQFQDHKNATTLNLGATVSAMVDIFRGANQ